MNESFQFFVNELFQFQMELNESKNFLESFLSKTDNFSALFCTSFPFLYNSSDQAIWL